ncbi:hypothetical protein [Aquibacillus albus]|uniref:Uncharacterized protein n=1 Tax=Aquibacillus albus TaxID=1168171 RepID=A0ABS2N473_9BACI|nr:hypothetical protein [Aquibacillus albus]MBM7572923.1 hypothetical protein [Aquibacillus albus]
MKNLKDELKQLRVVKKALNVEKHQHQVGVLSVLVSEIYDSIKFNELDVYVNYNNGN